MSKSFFQSNYFKPRFLALFANVASISSQMAVHVSILKILPSSRACCLPSKSLISFPQIWPSSLVLLSISKLMAYFSSSYRGHFVS